MSNRRDFYFRQRVTEGELDQAFSDLEDAERAIMSDQGLIGITVGLEVVQQAAPNLTVQVSGPGIAYDQVGRRIAVPATQTVDCAVDEGGLNTAVITPGNERYISIFVQFDRDLSDPRVDGNGVTVFFSRAESFRFNVVAGPEGPSPVRPPLRSDQIHLADILLTYGKTEILNADIDYGRRQWMFRTASGTPIAAGTLKEVIQLLADDAGSASTGLADHLSSLTAHGANAIVSEDLPPWRDGTTHPAAKVQDQLERIIAELRDNSGSSRIGAEDYAPNIGGDPSAFPLQAGSIQDQLQAISRAIHNLRSTSKTIPLQLGQTDIDVANGPFWLFEASQSRPFWTPYDHGGLRGVVTFPIEIPRVARLTKVIVKLQPGTSRPDSSHRFSLSLVNYEINWSNAAFIPTITTIPLAEDASGFINDDGTGNVQNITLTPSPALPLFDPGSQYYFLRIFAPSNGTINDRVLGVRCEWVFP